MVYSSKQQIYENVKRSNSILICLPKDPTIDAIAAGLAFGLGGKDLAAQILSRAKKDVSE